MAFRASWFKKLKRWILAKRELPELRESRSVYSQQIGKLLKNQGNEIVTMMSL